MENTKYFSDDLAILQNYDSAFDIDFLDSVSKDNDILFEIARLIDKCDNFADFKKSIGNDKVKQYDTIIKIYDFYVNNACDGQNLFDTVEYFAIFGGDLEL